MTTPGSGVSTMALWGDILFLENVVLEIYETLFWCPRSDLSVRYLNYRSMKSFQNVRYPFLCYFRELIILVTFDPFLLAFSGILDRYPCIGLD